eukprot:8868407-Pyramimonas_sp.AAC.1
MDAEGCGGGARAEVEDGGGGGGRREARGSDWGREGPVVKGTVLATRIRKACDCVCGFDCRKMKDAADQ